MKANGRNAYDVHGVRTSTTLSGWTELFKLGAAGKNRFWIEWRLLKLVIPAKAGIQWLRWTGHVRRHWIPAFAG